MKHRKHLLAITTVLLAVTMAAGINQLAADNGAATATNARPLHAIAPQGSVIAPLNPNIKWVKGPGYVAPQAFTNDWRDQELEFMSPTEQTMRTSYMMNAEPTTQFRAVGLLLESVNGSPPVAKCTGALIDSDTFLTAAHCIKTGANRKYLVFFQHVGVVAVLDGGIKTYCSDPANTC